MNDSNPLSKSTGIKLAERHDPDTHLYDLRIFLELGEAAPDGQRVVGIPFDYGSFLPVSWDQQRESRRDDARTLIYEVLEAGDDHGLKAEDLICAGVDDGTDAYETVAQYLRRAHISDPAASIKPYSSDEYLSATPAKLLLCLVQYALQGISDSETQDRVGLIVDKLALLTLLPRLLKATVEFLTPAPDGSIAVKDLATLDSRLQQSLDGVNLSAPESLELEPHDRNRLRISIDEWKSIIAVGGDWKKLTQVLFPLDTLEDVCRENLHRVFRQWLESGDKHAGIWQSLESLVTKHNAAAKLTEPRRSDYGVFYEVIETILAHSSQLSVSNWNLYKLPYRESLPVMPVIEEIDTRAPLWAAEADSLFTERALASSLVDLAKTRLKTAMESDNPPNTTQIDELTQEVRRANRALFQVRRNLEVLKDELADSGYVLRADGDDFGVHRKHSYTRVVTIRRRLSVLLARTSNEEVRPLRDSTLLRTSLALAMGR